MVICFCTAAQLISHRETRETLLDYYSERWSVSLCQIPYLIHLSLSFSLLNILVIFNNSQLIWRHLRPLFDILHPWLNNDGSPGSSRSPVGFPPPPPPCCLCQLELNVYTSAFRITVFVMRNVTNSRNSLCSWSQQNKKHYMTSTIQHMNTGAL